MKTSFRRRIEQLLNLALLTSGAIAVGFYRLQLQVRHSMSAPSPVSLSSLWTTPVLVTAAIVLASVCGLASVRRAFMTQSWSDGFLAVARWFWSFNLFYLAPLVELRWFNPIDDIIVTVVILCTLISIAKDFHLAGKLPQAAQWFERSDRLHARRLAACVAILCCIVPLLYALECFARRQHPDGDEPSYLTITQSIAFDHDVIMENNYNAQQYRRFYSGRYPMFTHLGKNGHNYPHHSIGLPLLLAPVYWLVSHGSDLLLIRGIRVYMVLWFGLLAYHLILLGQRVTGSIVASAIAVLLGSLSPPLLFYATEAYPEILAALVLVVSLRVLWSETATTSGHLWLGFAVGALPWLGIKYFMLSGALGVLWVVRWLRSHNKICSAVVAGGGFLPVICLYFWFLFSLYGNLSPSSIYTGVIPGTNQQPASTAKMIPVNQNFFAELPKMLRNCAEFWVGIFIEQRIGLLVLAPIFFYSLWGIIMMCRQHPRTAMRLLLPFVLYLTNYGWQANWGGFCPPNRPIIAVAPILIIALAFGLKSSKKRLHSYLAPCLVFISWSISLWFLCHPRALFHTMNPTVTGGASNFLAALSMPFGPNWPDFFPLIMGAKKNVHVILAWCGFLALLLAVFVISAWRQPDPRPSSPWRHLYSSNARWFRRFFGVAGIAIFLFYRWWMLPVNRQTITFDNVEPPYSVYLLDDQILGKELSGFWLRGAAKSRFIIGCQLCPQALEIKALSHVDNVVQAMIGSETFKQSLIAGETGTRVASLRDPIRRGNLTYFVAEVACKTGFIPADNWGTKDTRNLGVFIALRFTDEAPSYTGGVISIAGWYCAHTR